MARIRGKRVTFGDTTYTIENRAEIQTDGSLYVRAQTPTSGEKVLVYAPKRESLIDIEKPISVDLDDEVQQGDTRHRLIVELQDEEYINVFELESVEDNTI